MARRTRPVLYEVVRRGERQKQTGWLSKLVSSLRGGEEQRADSETDSLDPIDPVVESEMVEETQASASELPFKPVPKAQQTPEPSEHTEAPVQQNPRLVFDDPRSLSPANTDPILDWQITLNKSALLAAGLGIVILLMISFEIGRQFGSPGNSENVDAAGSRSVSEEPTNRTPTRPFAANSGASGGVSLPERPAPRQVADEPLQPTQNRQIASVPSGRYLVVQNLGVQRKRDQRIPDGERIVSHLAGKGIQAKIIQPTRKAPHVIVSTPLDGMSSAAIENLKSRVRRAGQDFAGYDFKDCYETNF